MGGGSILPTASGSTAVPDAPSSQGSDDWVVVEDAVTQEIVPMPTSTGSDAPAPIPSSDSTYPGPASVSSTVNNMAVAGTYLTGNELENRAGVAEYSYGVARPSIPRPTPRAITLSAPPSSSNSSIPPSAPPAPVPVTPYTTSYGADDITAVKQALSIAPGPHVPATAYTENYRPDPYVPRSNDPSTAPSSSSSSYTTSSSDSLVTASTSSSESVVSQRDEVMTPMSDSLPAPVTEPESERQPGPVTTALRTRYHDVIGSNPHPVSIDDDSAILDPYDSADESTWHDAPALSSIPSVPSGDAALVSPRSGRDIALLPATHCEIPPCVSTPTDAPVTDSGRTHSLMRVYAAPKPLTPTTATVVPPVRPARVTPPVSSGSQMATTLKEMFPAAPADVIYNALFQCGDNIDAAVSYVLNTAPGSTCGAYGVDSDERRESQRKSLELIQTMLVAEEIHSAPILDSRDNDSAAVLAMLQQEEEERARIAAENDRLTQEFLARESAARQEALENKTYTCMICLGDCKIEEMYTLDECYHRVCSACLTQHIRTQVVELSRHRIVCPDPSCGHELSPSEIKHCVAPVTLAKFYDNALRHALSTMENLVWCPRPGCETAIVGDVNPGTPLLVCPSEDCTFAFCFNCKDAWHADATCEEYQAWKRMNDEAEDRFLSYSAENTKQCPKCKSPIEKNGGCNHMTCHCGYEFCWLCMEEYKRGHFRRSDCNQYT